MLKRITILLKLEKLSLAEAKLIEAESLADMLLKNSRVLLYMKEQYFLLIHLKQKTYRLRGMLLIHKNDPLNAAENLYKSLVRNIVVAKFETYGPIYRRKARLTILELFKTKILEMKGQGRGLEYEMLKR